MGICVQLFLTLRCVHESHDSHHHPLISCGQIPQKLPALFFLQFHVIRHSSGKVLVSVLPPLPVRDICFHAQKPVLGLIDRPRPVGIGIISMLIIMFWLMSANSDTISSEI